jgi:hypothetical protein
MKKVAGGHKVRFWKNISEETLIPRTLSANDVLTRSRLCTKCFIMCITRLFPQYFEFVERAFYWQKTQKSPTVRRASVLAPGIRDPIMVIGARRVVHEASQAQAKCNMYVPVSTAQKKSDSKDFHHGAHHCALRCSCCSCCCCSCDYEGASPLFGKAEPFQVVPSWCRLGLS